MTRSFAWLHLRTELPADWEMTLYAKEHQFGTLEFSNRDGHQAAFQWRQRGWLGKKGGADDQWEEDEKTPGTYTCHRGETDMNLRWEFHQRAIKQAADIVASTRDNRGDWRDFTLHGIQARVPAEFDLDKIQVYPANVMLGFTDGIHRRLVYRRWGLPAYVLQGKSPKKFFRRLLETEGMRVDDLSDEIFRGPAVAARFSNRGLTPAARLLCKRAQGRGWIWLETDTKRLCTFEQLGPRGADLPNPRECFGDV